MPKFLLTRWHGLHIVWALALILLLSLGLAYFHWELGLAAVILCGVLVYYTIQAEKAFRHDLNEYISTLSHRVKRAGNEVVNELPLGILLYNEDRTIEWSNPYIAVMADRDSLIGQPMDEIFPALKGKKEQIFEVQIGLKVYQVYARYEERLMYFRDVSEYHLLSKSYEEEKTVLGIVMMDNLDEVTQGMDDQSRNLMMSKVTSQIAEWALQYEIFLKRIASDKYLLVLDQHTLKELEQTKFELLDEIRELTADHKLPLTISMGFAGGSTNLIELGQLMQTSLDMALGRGGDQVAVKMGQRLSFYGGRSNAVEKRTRVRARVISHALRDLIKESEKVIITGHKNPDMDVIGAAVGMLKAVHLSGKEGYIVLEGVNPSIKRLLDLLSEDERIGLSFISPEEALTLVNPRTLVAVLDTHKASMLKEPRILQNTHRIVIVDHHRRGEDFIGDAILVYMEPYASSTCELVTELLQYFHDPMEISPLEATALLAGIVVDTKSFSLQTGARTFEAASYLRRNGADSALVRKLLKEDLTDYMKKAEIIKNAEIINDHIAIAVSEPGSKVPQLTIAQVADTLLNMNEILASFVISERPDGFIGISARSTGQINVQVIMEQLGGGGHLTNAATQLDGTLAEANRKLREVLNQMEEEEGLFE
ncbi:DHH family phosphoesterase [Paenibacillus gansuensis]|uniref:Cyclic-di-AMP phosphodiesterase n=1 Tax=Paenibacillus gansuensis TaxID=306542 RepID=A0ABW5PK54_9BACL